MRLPAILQGADRYLLVGLFNTAFDFTLFTLLAVGARLDPIVSNVISTAVVMTVSYAINRRWVFRSDSRGVRTYVGFATITGSRPSWSSRW
ncbi:MAG: GtrA family protein [Aeromicrobium sp.]